MVRQTATILQQTVTLDTLAAAEALLISFWNEVAEVKNGNRGTDREPMFMHLQEAIMLVEGASAALLWLMREQKKLGYPDWSIPFKKWNGPGWPDCYMQVPGGK